MDALLQRWEWFVERAEGAYTKAWLALLSFTESCVFVIPPDPLLVAIVLAGAKRWLYYATYTTVWSVAGAVAGYVLGAFFFDVAGAPLIGFYGLEEEVAVVATHFDRNTFAVMLLAAVTPIPFKAFVLAGGFLRVDFLAFIVASVIGRGMRYGLVAYATHKFGGYAIEFIRNYTVIATVVALVLISAYVLRHVIFA